ncbi:quinoprotein glucose dehydrogenase [Candidatus Woesearchaeota archaeon CG10_big_fil_rev_8_21_14_0_10_37_12]|nr:MAG: quinoprotein glucose dehydrogenase [Candidatus Woesearchaeota archaeon CG10_big_fil_rev_8_21_14_0_10_37_12]
MKRVILLLCIVLVISCSVEDTNDFEVLVSGLDTPWAIDFLPDGKMIFSEREGRVSILDKGVVREVGTIDVSELSESGLMGVAVDPEFNTNRFVYLYYTHETGNKVSRFTLNDQLENELVLLDNIPSAIYHDGGRIKFGPDGKLYITTGDATEPSSAQDLNSVAGKILRINKDGTIPDDNPFGNYVFSYGHRNSQGIAWHPVTNDLFVSEHGPTRNDEINIITKGKNYGWPAECTGVPDGFTNPIRCFTEFTLAPAGIAIHNNVLYVAALRGAQVRMLVLGDDHKTIVEEKVLFNDLGRVRDVVMHDGYLYIATSNWDGRGIPHSGDDKILRIKLTR